MKILSLLIIAAWISIQGLWASTEPIAAALPAESTDSKVQGPCAAPVSPTVIQSDSLDVKTTPAGNIFYFKNNVRIEAQDLKATCDLMEVYSQEKSEGITPRLAEVGAIDRIVAIGHVRIEQAGRVATAGRAEIIPSEGCLILSEDPVVIDEQGQVRGYRIILLKDEKRAIVEGQPDGARPRVVLPPMPSFNAKGPQIAQPSANSEGTGAGLSAPGPSEPASPEAANSSQSASIPHTSN
ncbi:MAG: hypothetical protein B7X06_00410 [Verrucomicrobia bacterium 21-51-4]|nr:MAG: hypothetical protein B7X06_00410 [Verrucomicrobia bacterium 21-51-4]HQU08531.1 hypothetical protein [Opitutales bacterium]